MSDDTEIATLETTARELATRIPLLAIVDAPTFAAAVQERAEIKRRLARIGELMDPICTSTHQAWKTAVAQRDGLRAPFLMADKAYSRKMGEYEQAQERQRQEAEAATRREQQRREAEERARVAAEQSRLQAEAEAVRVAEIAAAKGRGDVAATLDLAEAPVVAPIVTANPVYAPRTPLVPPPRAAGVSFSTRWSAEVTDLLTLVKAVAGGQAPLSVLTPAMPVLNAMARDEHDRLNIPGVRAVSERIAAQKAAPARDVFAEEA